MCTWPSMRPGTTVRPLRSMTRVLAARAGGVSPTATNRPFLIDTVLAMVFRASIVWIRPLVRTSVASGCARPPAAGGSGAWPARTIDAGPLPRAAAVPAAVAAPMNCRREKPFL